MASIIDNKTRKSTSDDFRKKVGAVAFTTLLTSGCAHMAGQAFEEYNVRMDSDKFDKKYVSEASGFNLLHLPGMAINGLCYMVQETLRAPIHFGAIAECGIRNAFSKNQTEDRSIAAPDSSTENTPLSDSTLPPFCNFD